MRRAERSRGGHGLHTAFGPPGASRVKGREMDTQMMDALPGGLRRGGSGGGTVAVADPVSRRGEAAGAAGGIVSRIFLWADADRFRTTPLRLRGGMIFT